MTQTTDVIVVGGGIIGCFIAYELAKAGLDVVVVEKGEIGAEASSASAGLLVPMHTAATGRTPQFDLFWASTQLFVQLIPEIEAETGISVEYLTAGALSVAMDEAEARVMQAQYHAWKDQLGMKLTWLDQQALHTLEPELTPHATGAIYAEQEASINSARMVMALARAAAMRGVQFWQGTIAEDVRRTNNRFVALKTSAGEINANQLVVAAGAWSGAFCERLGISLPIAPARGQMLAVRPIKRLLRRPISASVGGVSPRKDGTIYVGATVDLAGFDKRIRLEDTATLLKKGEALLPRLREGHIERIWAGLRPYCEDGLPIIGMLPNWDNVSVASGHFMMGITGSAATAKIITQLITTGQSTLEIRHFSPARFA